MERDTSFKAPSLSFGSFDTMLTLLDGVGLALLLAH